MKKIWKYLITTGVGLAATLVVLLVSGTFTKTQPLPIFQDLMDSFFIPGAVLLFVGLLVCATNGGALDALSYGAIRLVDSFRKDVRNAKWRTYYDYSEHKKSQKRSFWHLVIVGAAFIAVAAVFWILRSNALQQAVG